MNNLVPSANGKIKDLERAGDSDNGGMVPPGVTSFKLYFPRIPKIGNSVVVVNTSGKAGAQIPHPPLGDDSSPRGGVMQYAGNLTRFTRMCVTSHSQPLINTKYQIPSNKLIVNNN
jgi:hypothetical protein